MNANAFATKFLGAQYVVLHSDVVDAMSKHVDGVRFYIGHELGHLRMKHFRGHLLRWPVLWLPLLGAAYSRARESTCDRHGLACSSSPESAARALAALSAGTERWADLDLAAYRQQANHSAGFWMSFHELTAAYPWLTKRTARVLDAGAPVPRRNALAYFLAAFVPYAGRLGGGFGLVLFVYIVGVLAAVAVPAYHAYTAKAKLTTALVESQDVREALAGAYLQSGKIPGSLESLGLRTQLSDGSQLALGKSGMVLTVTTSHGALVFTPSANANGDIVWSCAGARDVKEGTLPSACMDGDQAKRAQ